MAKILCSYSGLEIEVQHFPVFLDGAECFHPVFLIPPKKLTTFYNKWTAGELTSTDSYLLFLALLESTELVEFRTAVRRTADTDSIVANYMPLLFSTVGKIAGILHPSFSIPNIAITSETNDLSNVKYWLDVWNNSYIDFLSGLRSEELRTKLERRERALEKLIKSPQISPSRYAVTLAAWAAEAGQFPSFSTINIATGEEVTLSNYWQDIIVRCYSTENILSIPPKDLQELHEHCLENVDGGTIFSYQLFAAIEEGISRQKSFFGVGELLNLTAENPGFRILSTETSVEDANIAIMVGSAPTSLPLRSSYPSEFLFLKAKMRYEAAQKYGTT